MREVTIYSICTPSTLCLVSNRTPVKSPQCVDSATTDKPVFTSSCTQLHWPRDIPFNARFSLSLLGDLFSISAFRLRCVVSSSPPVRAQPPRVNSKKASHSPDSCPCSQAIPMESFATCAFDPDKSSQIPSLLTTQLTQKSVHLPPLFFTKVSHQILEEFSLDDV